MHLARPRQASLALLALGLLASSSSAAPGPEAAPVDPWQPVLLPAATAAYPTSSAGRRHSVQDSWGAAPPRGLHWRQGQYVLQGWLGFTDWTGVSLSGGSTGPVEGQGIQNFPVIGGGAQWKLNAGERIDLGLEALINFGGRANGGAVWFGGGGGGVAVNVDMWMIELLGGFMVSKTLGGKSRLYGGAGPVMQWVNYAQDGPQADSGSGFGTGWYARAGWEFAMSSSSTLGVGARYSETTVGLGSSLGDLDVEGWQYLFTITRGF